MYIIIWRATHREPFVSDDSRGFIEEFSTYQEAVDTAKEYEDKTGKDPHYFDWKIYEEASN